MPQVPYVVVVDLLDHVTLLQIFILRLKNVKKKTKKTKINKNKIKI